MDRSSLYDTFARAPLAFVRGEGAWVETTDGRRLLDFAGGDRGQHARPCPPGAGRRAEGAGREDLACLQPLPHSRAGAACRDALPRGASPTRSSSATPGPKPSSARSRPRAATSSSTAIPSAPHFITFTGAFHGRTLTALAATGNPKYLEGMGRPPAASSRWRSGDIKAVEAAIGRRRRRSWSSRSRARAASASPPASSCATSGRSATSTISSSSSTRCRPASAAPAGSSPMSGRA